MDNNINEKTSFSSRVKQELFQAEPHGDCCVTAEAYGMLLFGRHFDRSSISILTENRVVAEAYERSVANTAGSNVRTNLSEAGNYSVFVATSAGRRKVMSYFSVDEGELSLRVNRANLLNESGDELNCCYSAFLRGAFLSCGTISDPEKNYHLEFDVSHKKLSEDLVKVINEIGLVAKTTTRRGSNIVYFKDSESIEDILTFMGAANCSLEIMAIKMFKSKRNTVNRKNNFDTANITRTADAAAKQINAIRIIEKYAGLDSLPPQLRDLARLRLDCFDMSLSELGAAMTPPVSRSGVNHRLKRLQSIASELLAENENNQEG